MHDSAGVVEHRYYDHRTQQYRQQALYQKEIIWRYSSHIAAKRFKMMRYYGFLSNRKQDKLLPKVYKTLQKESRKITEPPGFAALMTAFLRIDPQMHPVRQSASLALKPANTLRNGWREDCTESTDNDGFRYRQQNKLTRNECFV